MNKLILIIQTCLISTIMAWGPNGHMLIAQMAELELKTMYPKIYEIANNHVKSMGELSGNNTDFASAAAWPDQIRSSAMNFWSSWHFYQRPYNPDGIYTMQSLKGNSSNSINCLHRAKSELRNGDPEQPDLQKAIFIRFALHVVGDIHQPLHSTIMFNETYPNSDLGGNFLKIQTIHNETLKLHSFWDRGAQYFQKPHERSFKPPLSQQNKTDLIMWAKELMAQYPKSFFNGLEENLDYNEWTKESFRYSQNTSYPLMFESNILTKEYTENAQEVCRQRAVLAAYRLVNYLKDVYEPYLEKKSEQQDIKKFLN